MASVLTNVDATLIGLFVCSRDLPCDEIRRQFVYIAANRQNGHPDIFSTALNRLCLQASIGGLSDFPLPTAIETLVGRNPRPVERKKRFREK